jgi:CRISPR system Cascade subunit CasD
MTGREPTKSGVIGFIASALGIRRSDSEGLLDLQALSLGIRIDQPGKQLRDYHTAHNYETKQAFVSNRYYLMDAIFLVGIEGEVELLKIIDEALQYPAFPLFLGRRSCPPVGRVSLGIRDGIDLIRALREEPWQASLWYQKKLASPVHLEIVRDIVSFGENGYTKRDMPISFDQEYRKYDLRTITNEIVIIENPNGKKFHDPMEDL